MPDNDDIVFEDSDTERFIYAALKSFGWLPHGDGQEELSAEQDAGDSRDASGETGWAMAALEADESSVADQIGSIFERYYSPLVRYAIRSRGMPAHDAEELVHDFFCTFVMQRNGFSSTLRNAIDLRKSIMLLFKRHIVKSQTGNDQSLAPPAANVRSRDILSQSDTCGDEHVVGWHESLIVEAAMLTRRAALETGRLDLWHVLNERAIKPFVERVKPTSYTSLKEMYGFASVRTIQNLFVQGKRLFKQQLRQVVQQQMTPDDNSEMVEWIESSVLDCS